MTKKKKTPKSKSVQTDMQNRSNVHVHAFLMLSFEERYGNGKGSDLDGLNDAKNAPFNFIFGR